MNIEQLLNEYDNSELPIEITPDLAKRILEIFPNDSRPVSERRVSEYCELMKNNLWETREDSPIIIGLSDEGDWDGKHRLLAFLKSGLQKLETFFTIHKK